MIRESVSQNAELKGTATALRSRRPGNSPSMGSPMSQIAFLQRAIGNQAVQRRFDSSAFPAGRSLQRVEARVENGIAGNQDECSGWRQDPQSLSKRAAELYVQTELSPLKRAGAGLPRKTKCDTSPLCCRKADGIAACDVEYDSGLVVVVTIYPDRVECHTTDSPRCTYDYTCPSGQLVFKKRECI